MAAQPIYEFYAELSDYKPNIWRRFQVAGNITLARLGYIVMTLFEMQGSHEFSVDYPVEENLAATAESLGQSIPFAKAVSPEDERYYHYEILGDDTLPSDEKHKVCDARLTTVRRVSNKPGLRLDVMYDPGDGWEVKLVLERVFEDADLPGDELPRVLAGEGYGIIEDCGGPDSLAKIKSAYDLKSGKCYKQYVDWIGDAELDLTRFDLEDMNFRLKKVPLIFKKIYEDDYAPTKQSLEVLNRTYQENICQG